MFVGVADGVTCNSAVIEYKDEPTYYIAECHQDGGATVKFYDNAFCTVEYADAVYPADEMGACRPHGAVSGRAECKPAALTGGGVSFAGDLPDSGDGGAFVGPPRRQVVVTAYADVGCPGAVGDTVAVAQRIIMLEGACVPGASGTHAVATCDSYGDSETAVVARIAVSDSWNCVADRQQQQPSTAASAFAGAGGCGYDGAAARHFGWGSEIRSMRVECVAAGPVSPLVDASRRLTDAVETFAPTAAPPITAAPTAADIPTYSPTAAPSSADIPTYAPTMAPTMSAMDGGSRRRRLTFDTTAAPSAASTATPTTTDEFTYAPSAAPTTMPTIGDDYTDAPTAAPTVAPVYAT
ncbi:unnamed protein product [Phaeothamnion confervicola]